MLVLYPDGRKEAMALPEGQKTWRLEELQTLVGGYLQECPTVDGRILLVDEDGKRKRKPINELASKLYPYGQQDPIVGVALIITREDLNGDDEDDD